MAVCLTDESWRSPGRPRRAHLSRTPAAPQGVGKTTACGKLALYLTKQKKSVLLVATDVYRPAAIEQLVKLGQTLEVPVFQLGECGSSPLDSGNSQRA